MGEAKRKRESRKPTVYHHTSIIRTNLIWMSGVIQVEGQSKGALHPKLGEIKTDASLRRALRDFPPVAWFTTRIDIPKCLIESRFVAVDKDTGERIMEIDANVAQANAIALNRVALGFPIADIPVIPWPEHPGYVTDEGKELNETAREFGDNPDEWYVAEQPVDVLKVSEFWSSKSVMKPKLERIDKYIPDIHRMVEAAKKHNAFIPPSWLTPEQAMEFARRSGLKVME